MNGIRLAIAVTAFFTMSGASGQASEPSRLVRAKLIHSGYSTKNQDYVYGPEGTDQVWAEWTYRSCQGKRGSRTYVRHMLVHALRFPEAGGLYLLTVSPDGEVRGVIPDDPHLKTAC
ncbi:hypothetical protein U1839_15055 [Sphingomonas sp. RT2P30]|uniref:hypothetical protein n=1 Tax=Parasphingomonas halimpatiens TaxID=3096162 RepID=UPI002FCC7C7F